jgi:hypothetical protein
MIEQVLPLIALSGIFGIYTLYHIARHFWFWMLYAPQDLADVMHTITPTETPFSERIKENKE